MKKFTKSVSELEEIALLAIKRHEGCETIRKVAVSPVRDDRADCNWALFVSDLGSADKELAQRHALSIQERLSQKYDLIVDAPDGMTRD